MGRGIEAFSRSYATRYKRSRALFTSHSDLLDILDAGPRLEELDTGDEIGTPKRHEVRPHHLRLPYLKSLKLDGSAVPCARLIQILDLPDTVRINLHGMYSSLDDWRTLFSTLAQHFSPRLSFRRLSLSSTTDLVVMGSAPYNANESVHELSTASSGPTLLYFECMEPVVDGAHIIRAALGTLPYADLTELIVRACNGFPGLWTDVLRPLKRVQYLRIEDEYPSLLKKTYSTLPVPLS